jgi:hypothetical protein
LVFVEDSIVLESNNCSSSVNLDKSVVTPIEVGRPDKDDKNLPKHFWPISADKKIHYVRFSLLAIWLRKVLDIFGEGF